MDVFKAWPGRAESIVISQESYMGCTGGVAPWRRDGDTGPSYYAVCPLCDNPIQIVGLFRRQEERMLFFAAGGQNLVKRYIVPGSPLHERLKGVPQVRLAPTRSRYVQVDKAGPGFLTLDFLLYARRIEWDGQHMNETFRLRGLLGRDDGQQAFDDLTLDVDQDWLPHTADAQPGRDERLLDIARETLQSDAGIPADQ